MTTKAKGITLPYTTAWYTAVTALVLGSSGPVTKSSSFWPDVSTDIPMQRMAGRLFVYDGVTFTGNRDSSQQGFLPDSTYGAAWAPRDSAIFGATKRGLMAITGFASNENMDMTVGQPTETIGISGFAIGKQAGRSVWGLYSDVQFEAGTNGYGCEFAVKNKSGVDQTAHPYFQIGGAVGIWFPAGGDPTYGGAPTSPNNWVMGVGKGASTWNKGIVFFKDSLTGSDGTTGTATAIEMAKGHSIVWRNTGGTALTIRSDSTAGSNDIYLLSTNSNFRIAGLSETPIADFTHNASAVNYVKFNNATTGNLVTISAQGTDPSVGIQLRTLGTQSVRFQSQGSGTTDEFRVGGVNSLPVNYLHAYGSNSLAGLAYLEAKGTDTDIDIRLATKGAGLVSFGTWTSNADAPITGYILVKDKSGTQRKLATIA